MTLRFAAALSLGCVGLWAQGQGNGPGQNPGHGNGDPFIQRSDTGATVRVLPAPALLHAGGGDAPFSPAHFSATTYAASYGSGNLIDHGGYEIPNAAFQPIYWNASVAASKATSLGYPTLSAEIGAFINVLADGKSYSSADSQSDYTLLQQYGTTRPISGELVKRPDFVDKQKTVASYSDSAIQAYLASLFNQYANTRGRSGVAPGSSVIYGLYFPSGMEVCLGSACSCGTFCGYHSHFSFGNTQIKYVVFPYPDCSACTLGSLKPADMLTIIGSHEIGEAVTNPGDFGNNAWFDASGYEAYDKCAWHNLYQLNRPASKGLSQSFWVQPPYSNGGTVNASGFIATYPGPGCIVTGK